LSPNPFTSTLAGATEHGVLPPEVSSAAPVGSVAATAQTPGRRVALVNAADDEGGLNCTLLYGTSSTVGTFLPKYSMKLYIELRSRGLAGEGLRSANVRRTPSGRRIVARYHPPATGSTVYWYRSPALIARPSGILQLTPGSPSKPDSQFGFFEPSASCRTSAPTPLMLNTAVGPTTPLTEFPSVCTPM